MQIILQTLKKRLLVKADFVRKLLVVEPNTGNNRQFPYSAILYAREE